MSPDSINLVKNLLQKDPNQRFSTIGEIKKHTWLKSVNWELLKDKRVKPPIVPSVKECHIDPDYVELPLDFEES